jgi:hypothetical protein
MLLCTRCGLRRGMLLLNVRLAHGLLLPRDLRLVLSRTPGMNRRLVAGVFARRPRRAIFSGYRCTLLLHGFSRTHSLRRTRFFARSIRLNVPGRRTLRSDRTGLRPVHQPIAFGDGAADAPLFSGRTNAAGTVVRTIGSPAPATRPPLPA